MSLTEQPGNPTFTSLVRLCATGWLREPGYNVPPMPMRIGLQSGQRAWHADAVRAAVRYALRVCTKNGTASTLDADDLAREIATGLLGYWTDTGESHRKEENPAPLPPAYLGEPLEGGAVVAWYYEPPVQAQIGIKGMLSLWRDVDREAAGWRATPLKAGGVAGPIYGFLYAENGVLAVRQMGEVPRDGEPLGMPLVSAERTAVVQDAGTQALERKASSQGVQFVTTGTVRPRAPGVVGGCALTPRPAANDPTPPAA